MEHKWQTNRRRFLRGLGTVMALPVLESMLPMRVDATAAAGGPSQFPKRLFYIYAPNGQNMEYWKPKAAGAAFELPRTLEPLTSLRGEVSVLTGLTLDKAFAHGDGGGDHARALSSYLTGCQARKTDGANIRAGVSADQIAASKIGNLTRFPSLEVGCEPGGQAGNCDSGYSCAYSHNLAWKTETTPVAKEINPRLIFERLFTNFDPRETAEARAKRERYHKSVLDFVLDDARQLQSRLGADDKAKMEEYLSSVRELEMRIEQAGKFAVELPKYEKPTGIPSQYPEHLRLIYDLVALAFQGDLTRVSTMLLGNAGSNKPYSFIGVSEGHHDLSHHEGNEQKKEKIAKINRFHIEQFALFLKKLSEIREGEGSLLDNCMIIYGSGISDGMAHNHDDLPIILAGRGGGTLNPGRHVVYKDGTPLANLHLSLLDRMGAPADHVGDSSGRLENV
jgi:hypothetical protein